MGSPSLKAFPYPWVVVALVCLAQFAGAFPSQGFPVLYPFIQEEMALSRAQVGLITSAMVGSGCLLVLVGGRLTDTIGAKRVIVVSLGAASALFTAFLMTYSFPAVLVLAVLIGAAVAPIYPASTRAIMDWAPPRVMGLAMSLKQTGVPLAGALAAAILPALSILAGWRVGSMALGLLILITGFLILLKYRDAPRKYRTSAGISLSSIRALTRQRTLVATTIWGMAFVGLQYITLSYLVLFLIEKAGISPIAAGSIMAATQVASFVARIFWGGVSDFLLQGRRTITLAILGLVATAGLFATGRIEAGTSLAPLFLVAITLGITTLSWNGVFTVSIGEMAESNQVGTTVGAVSTIMYLTTAIISPLFGLLVDLTSYRTGWTVAAALALASTLTLLALGNKRHVEHPLGSSTDSG